VKELNIQYVLFDETEGDDWLQTCWKTFSLDEWYFGAKPKIETSDDTEFEGGSVAAIMFSISVARKTHFYVWNVLWLMYFLNIITWCVFIIPPDSINDRLSVTITIFLSELAFNLIISSILPRVSYNTYFSLYFLFNYLSLALQSLEHVLSFELDDKLDNKEIAKYVDYGFILGFIVLHTVLVILCYSLSVKHNAKHKNAILQEVEQQKDEQEKDKVE